jgi:hypothetical protein
MRQAPKETVDSWLKQPELDALRLVPSLLQVQQAPRDPLSPNQAIRYLHHVVFEQPNTTPTIHNLLITFCLSIGVGEQWRVLARGRRAAAAFALSRSAYSRS